MSTFLIFFFILSNLKSFSGILLIGTRVREGQFPWLIQFKTIAPCGGILVSADWVLTAAQCVETDRQSISLQAVGLNGTGSLQVIRVLHAYIHPEYKVQFHDHDHNIALIKLVKPFDLCDSEMRFLDIAPLRLDDNYKTCLIFGWQSYVGPSTKVFAKPIQYSQVVLNAWKYCIYMHKGNASFSNVFCTMIEANGDMKACAGNPGTPVVCEDQYQRMVLLGIASWTKFSFDCGDLPSYLSVSIFRSWIYELVINVSKLENLRKPEIENLNCKNEPQGGIYGENFHNRTQLLKTNWKSDVDDISGILEKARKLNIIDGIDKVSSKSVSKQSIIWPTDMNKMSIFENENEHRIVSNNEDIITVGNIKEREKSLRQYQEVGLNVNDRDEDSTKDAENSDEIDKFLPFIFEEYHSTAASAFINPSFWKCKIIFYLSYLYILNKQSFVRILVINGC